MADELSQDDMVSRLDRPYSDPEMYSSQRGPSTPSDTALHVGKSARPGQAPRIPHDTADRPADLRRHLSRQKQRVAPRSSLPTPQLAAASNSVTPEKSGSLSRGTIPSPLSAHVLSGQGNPLHGSSTFQYASSSTPARLQAPTPAPTRRATGLGIPLENRRQDAFHTPAGLVYESPEVVALLRQIEHAETRAGNHHGWKGEYDQLWARYTKLDKNRQEQASELRNARSKVKELESRANERRENQSTVRELWGSDASLPASADPSATNASSLSLMYQHLQDQLDEKSNALDQTTANTMKLLDDRSKVQNEIRKTQEENRKAQDDRSKLKNEIKKAQDDIRKVQNEIRKAQDDRSKLQNEFRKAQDDRSKLQNEIRKAQDDRSKLQNEIRKAQDDISKARNDTRKAQDDRSKVQNDIRSAQDDLRNASRGERPEHVPAETASRDKQSVQQDSERVSEYDRTNTDDIAKQIVPVTHMKELQSAQGPMMQELAKVLKGRQARLRELKGEQESEGEEDGVDFQD